MNLTRRDFGRAALVGAAATTLPAALSTTDARAAAATAPATDAAEQKELQRLHRKAAAEGGEVVVYMGGDAPGFWDFISGGFTAAFPDVKIHMVTDLSKYHNARIDNQLATGDLVADVAILQTTQDFDRWKAAGELLQYRPTGYDQVFANAKDDDGYWIGVFYAAFSPLVATSALPSDPSTFRATDLLTPTFTDKIIATYPNDDDAVLFQYKLTIDRYGWDWLERFVAQKPTFLRGVPGSAAGIANGPYLATPASAGNVGPRGQQVLSRYDHFTSWAQRRDLAPRQSSEHCEALPQLAAVPADAEEPDRDLDLVPARRRRTSGLAEAVGRLPHHRPARLPGLHARPGGRRPLPLAGGALRRTRTRGRSRRPVRRPRTHPRPVLTPHFLEFS